MTGHVGDWGETLAADHLARAGWTLLARNYRIGRNEIDLVARRDEVVAFVEVKTRATTTMGHPLESITPQKRAALARVAERWIQQFGAAGDIYRFDAIAVKRRGCRVHVEHVEGAWGI